ncbi:MAG: hypothetical protein HY980_02385 [Candidatus Magasanikbacteria bacterium]|nr:hypothetical protein [Candidatus Magasanikbacteria bacterium]
MTVNPITSGQRKQYLRFVEDAAERALKETALDKDGIQKLIENGDEFQSRIITAIRELSVSNRFADEEVQSSYAYPNDHKVKGITEQTNILRQLFPGIGFADEKLAEQPLPPNAEGWFAIPKWQTLAPTYGKAVEKVLAMIASKRKFYNYHDGQLGAKYLRQHAKTVKMFQKLDDEQKDFDILVVPCQFGLRHKGRSVRRAREVFAANEFGLGTFAIGIMLLTHPEREVQWKQFHVDCAGDEFAPGADFDFSFAPLFVFHGAKVEFRAYWCNYAREHFGSASAFLSQ